MPVVRLLPIGTQLEARAGHVGLGSARVAAISNGLLTAPDRRLT